jgi:hypothetical protein
MSLDPITGILNIIDDVVQGVSGDQKEKLAIQLQALLSQTQLNVAQANIDAAEVANPRATLLQDWRDVVGWVCAASFAWTFVLQPICLFVASATGHAITVPSFDTASMSTILMGMLGLGGMRSFENSGIKKK